MEIWSGTTWKRKEEVKNPKRMFKKKEKTTETKESKKKGSGDPPG